MHQLGQHRPRQYFRQLKFVLSEIVKTFFIQVILYFKVYHDLSYCPIILLPALVLWAILLLLSWPIPINVSAIRRRLIIRELIIVLGC